MKNKYDHHIHNVGKSYGSRPEFALYSDLLGSGIQGFSSIYGVDASAAQAIQQEGTTTGFKGVVWSERLWLDFDSYEASDKAGKKLEEMGYDYIAFDTGNRGCHFGILRDAPPSHLLPARDKAWVKAHFEEADTSIYTHLHLFRLPGTIHEGTGKPKTFIGGNDTGKALILPERSEDYGKHYIGNVSGNISSGVSVFDNHRVMANTVPQRSGERHPTLVKLAYALQDHGVAADSAFWWLSETNKLFDEPKEIECIEQIVRSIFTAPTIKRG